MGLVRMMVWAGKLGLVGRLGLVDRLEQVHKLALVADMTAWAADRMILGDGILVLHSGKWAQAGAYRNLSLFP